MPEPARGERRVPKAHDLESRVTNVEDAAEEIKQLLTEVHGAVVGTAKDAGHGERIRALERFARIITGAAYAAAVAVLVAWGMVAAGPPRSPHP